MTLLLPALVIYRFRALFMTQGHFIAKFNDGLSITMMMVVSNNFRMDGTQQKNVGLATFK